MERSARPAKVAAWLGLLALLAVGVFLTLVVLRAGDGHAIFSPRWDGTHYLSIAERGYYLRDCGPARVSRGWTICGNPWFPGWSYWNWLWARVAGVAVAVVFPWNAVACTALATLVALWAAARAAKRDLAAPDLFYCAVFPLAQPAGFYFFTHFPYAFVALLSWTYLFLLYGPAFRARSALLAALAAGISLAYPTAALLAAFPLVHVLREGRHPAAAFRAVGAAVAFAAGTLIVCLIFWNQFGDFWLYFRHHAQYGRVGGAPLAVIGDTFRALRWDGSLRGPFPEAFSFLWYGLGIVGFSRSRSWRSAPELGFYLAAVYLLSPLTGSAMSVHRHYLLLFPLGLWIALSARPAWLRWGFLLAGLAAGLLSLLPRYVGGSLI